MELLVIGTAALFAAALTFFSGFGVGTLMTPVFALFFPLPLAIAATAVVHVVNNLFKLGLTVRDASWRVVAAFGIPAMLAAFGGAWLLQSISEVPPWFSYTLVGRELSVAPLSFLIGLLIAAFALLELWPRFQALAVAPRWLPLGGLLSGFFGGLSGHQGAFRSAFLLKTGLPKQSFIATGIVCAVIVDAARLSIYGGSFLAAGPGLDSPLLWPVLVGTLCACAGSLLGRRLLKKVTMSAVRLTVSIMMLVIGAGLMSGWI